MTSRGPRYARAASAPFRQLGDQVIVAPADGETFEVLEGTAVAVWSLLDQPRSVPDLVRILGGLFIADPKELERDVRALLRHLRHRGTVEVVDAGG